MIALAQEQARRRKYNYIRTLYPEEGPLSRHNYPKHMAFFRAGAVHNERAFLAANRIGKCLPLDAPVMMANGSWSMLSEIREGDYVMGYDLATGKASPVKVTEITRSGEMEVFETTFSDGGTVRCTREHWMPGITRSGKYQNSHGRKVQVLPKKRRFFEYMGSPSNAVSSRHRFLSPKLVDYLSVGTLPLHPYVVGALLGDGSLNREGVMFTTSDEPILEKILSLTQGLVEKAVRHKGDRYCYTLYQVKDGRNGLLSNALRGIGLAGQTCENKHIPDAYLTASEDDRLELLAGLVDTDGTHNDFIQKSERFTKDFARLVRSLGGKATVTHEKKTCTNATGGPKEAWYWRCTWRLNRRLPLVLDRKQPRISKRSIDYSQRIIRKIESLGMMDCGCITVDHPDHCFIAYDWVAVGNTEGVGGFELTLHATGVYPRWWEGRRFDRPIKAWAAGDTNQTVRDIIQAKLLGPVDDKGSGLIPKDLIHRTRPKQGMPDGVEIIYVKHVPTGGISRIGLKSYEAGRKSFQGTEQDIIWLDEEPPLSIYAECLIRTMTTEGMLLCTFTPLEGMTDVCMLYLKDGKIPDGGVAVSESTPIQVEAA